MTHTKENKYCCLHCEKTFKTAQKSQTHKRSHDAKKLLSCIHCEMGFFRFSHLKTHKMTHTSFSCDLVVQCDFKTSTQRGLNMHKIIMHKEKTSGEQQNHVVELLPKTGERSYSLSLVNPTINDGCKNEFEIGSDPIFEVKLDTDGNHIGQGTSHLCELLTEPPARVKHPDYGVGDFVEVDEEWGTFMYQFDGFVSEV